MDNSSLTAAERRALEAIARDLDVRSPLGRSLRTFTPPPPRGRRAVAAAVALLPLAVAPALTVALTGPTLTAALAALPAVLLLAGLTRWTLRGRGR